MIKLYANALRMSLSKNLVPRWLSGIVREILHAKLKKLSETPKVASKKTTVVWEMVILLAKGCHKRYLL